MNNEIEFRNNEEFTLNNTLNEYSKINENHKNTCNSKNKKMNIGNTNFNNNNNNINNVIQNNFKDLKKRRKNNKNNNHIFSKINDYWEKREGKNKMKMEAIKKEREQKIYGNNYPIPKINKNTKDIIQRIKNKSKNIISEEDKIEDQINYNIPIKTEQNIYFNNINNQITNNNNNNKSSNFDSKDSYINLMKLKLNKKRTITPRSQNINILKRNKIPINCNNKKNKILTSRDKQNLEKIFQLRKAQEEERIKNFKNREKICITNSNDRNNKKLKKNIKNERIKTEIKKTNNNKGNHIVKLKSSSLNNYNIHNDRNKDKMSYIMSQRKTLNEIYNTDKRITNHSYQSSTCRFNTSQTRKSDQKKIKIFYKYNTCTDKSFQEYTKLNNRFSKKSLNYYKKYNNKEKPIMNIYNTNKNKFFTHKHFGDNNRITNYNNYNRPQLQYFNLVRDRSFYNNNNNHFYKLNRNNMFNSYSYENKENFRNFNQLSVKNMINHDNILYKNSMFFNSNNESNRNFLQNESIENIYNELDNNLNKYRKENEQKLYELNNNIIKQKFNNKKYLPISLIKYNEESKNYFNTHFNDYKTLNNLTVKYILNSEQLNIENSLSYFNKELELNKEKKEVLFNNLYGRNNLIQNKRFSISENDLNDYISEKNEMIKNDDINDNTNLGGSYDYFKNSYLFHKIGKREKSEELNYDKETNNNNILGYFNFERKHKL